MGITPFGARETWGGDYPSLGTPDKSRIRYAEFGIAQKTSHTLTDSAERRIPVECKEAARSQSAHRIGDGVLEEESVVGARGASSYYLFGAQGANLGRRNRRTNRRRRAQEIHISWITMGSGRIFKLRVGGGGPDRRSVTWGGNGERRAYCIWGGGWGPS